MLKSFRGTFADELLLACAVSVASLMRWFTSPSRETYGKVPSMMLPTKSQKMKPHPSWIDMMVFPSFRDALVQQPRDWVEPCLRAEWQILWPHTLDQALNRHEDSQQIFISQEFAAFTVDPRNWMMTRRLLQDFPEVEGTEIHIG